MRKPVGQTTHLFGNSPRSGHPVKRVEKALYGQRYSAVDELPVDVLQISAMPTRSGLFGNGIARENTNHPAWQFIKFIFHQLAAKDEFVCVTKQGASGHWQNCLRESADFKLWTQADNPEAWYFTLATIDGELNAKSTMVGRGRDQLVRYHALMLDDIGGGEGSKASEPPVRPACKLETSAGNFQWIYRLKPGSDFATFAAVVEMLTEKGCGDPGAGGDYRVARLPGSANLKPERNGFLTKATYADKSTIWGLLDLAEALGLDRADVADRAAKKATKSAPKGMVTSTVTSISGGDLDPVIGWLNTAGYVRGDIDDKGFMKVQCPWHAQHTTGDDTASYSPLGHGGSYATTPGFNCFHGHCEDRNADDFLSWVKGLGGPTVERQDRLAVVQANYIFIERGPVVLDLRERRAGREPLRDMTEFRTANFGKVDVPGSDKKVSIRDAFLLSPNTIRCKDQTYVPTVEDEPLFTAPDGALLANMYQPPQWPETDVEPTIFLEHCEYLLQDPLEREYFMGWLAHKIQNPGGRGVGVVMIADGTYGVGRSWLGDLLERMLPNEVRRTDIKQLIGGNGAGAATYNDLYVHKQFVIADETQADETRIQYNSYESLKQLVDTRSSAHRINPKYGKTYEASFLFNLLAFSNNLDALHIPSGDRRFCILSNPTIPNSSSYYAALYAALDDAGLLAAVYWHLRRYDWSAINPRTPLQTKARAAMIEATKSPSEQIIEAMLKDGTMPDIMTHNILRDRIRLAAAEEGIDFHTSDRIITHIVKRLWLQMSDAPWKADNTDKRFRPRIRGKVTHIKAWRKDAAWPSEGDDWSDILSQHSSFGLF
jgi:hypothetical protein